MVPILGDLRFAWRQVCKAPLFSAVAMVTLALGIGANTAVFSVMDALLVRSLPVREPHGLSYVRMANGEFQPDGASSTGNSNTSFSLPVFTALRARTDVFADLMAFAPLAMGDTAVRAGSTPVQAEGEEVSGNFLSGLTAGMTLGRSLTAADEAAHAPVVVLSYAFWTREFHRDPGVAGKTLFVKGIPFTVVGVTARGFFGVEPATATDFWVPLQTQPALNAWGVTGGNSLYGSPNWWCLRMMARLRPGVSAQQAQAALAGTFLSAAKAGIGAGSAPGATAGSLGNWKPLLAFPPARGIDGYSEQYRQPVQMLMGLVLLILSIAMVNVALMLVARNTARTREFSLRLALGVSRARLFRQLATESGLLVAAGAGLGWLFAVGATQILAKLATIETGLSPNGTVLWFTLALSASMTFVFALSPLRAASRAPVCDVLRVGSTQMTQGRRTRLGGNAMIAGQVAVCLLLLVSAGLLLRTLGQYQQQPLGMQADKLLVFDITPQGNDDTGGALGFYRQLLNRLRVLPGVQGVSLAENRPGSGWSDNNGVNLDGGKQIQVRENALGPGYFHVVGTPLLEGRDFSESDTASSGPVAIVNATFARRYFPQGSAVGHHLGSGSVQGTIVGVVADSRYTSVDEPPMPMVYGAALQNPQLGKMTIELRTAGDPKTLLPGVRQAVTALNPDLPLADPMSQAEQFDLSYAQPEMIAVLGGFFGVLAALLVATGLYGSLAYRTNLRSTEIGVRMALGAQRGQVVWLVLREGLLFTGIGLACGLPLTLLVVRGMGSMLWNLSPYDPASLMVGMLGVVLVVAVASLIPARRAASIDPARAVRNA